MSQRQYMVTRIDYSTAWVFASSEADAVEQAQKLEQSKWEYAGLGKMQAEHIPDCSCED